MRDSWRERVYRAESYLNQDPIYGERLEIEMVQDIYDMLSEHFGVGPVEEVRKRKQRRYSGYYRYSRAEVTFSSKQPLLKVILHEYAHHLSYQRNGWKGTDHRASFVAAMLDIIEFWTGEMDRAKLRYHYAQQSVPLNREEETNRERRSMYRAAANRDRRGETGTGFVEARFAGERDTVTFSSKQPLLTVTFLDNYSSWAITNYIMQAKVARSRGTWEKREPHARRYREILEVNVMHTGSQWIVSHGPDTEAAKARVIEIENGLETS